jgi:hypothetical protein
VKERPVVEAMKREGRPVVKEECSMMESVTAPAAPHDILDRRKSLHHRRAPRRCDQGLGAVWYQESCCKNRRRQNGAESELLHLLPPLVSCCAFLRFSKSKDASARRST